jgi:outer membrane cobalamin receptor
MIDIDIEIDNESSIDTDIQTSDGEIDTDIELSTSGTNDYNDLVNKPSINGVELVGDKTTEELDILPLTTAEIDEFMNS